MIRSLFRFYSKMPKTWFYAVKIGRKPGIYSTWSECEEQVKGFKNAKYKKFGIRDEALKFISTDSPTIFKPKVQFTKIDPLKNDTIVTAPLSNKRTFTYNNAPKRLKINNQTISNLILNEVQIEEKIDVNSELEEDKEKMINIYTDGACSLNGQDGASAGIGVYWGPDHPLNTSKRLEGRPTNNRAEIHAAIYALNQAKTYGYKNITLHTDSKFMINSITNWITKWKTNGWKLVSGKEVINKEDFLLLEKAQTGLNVTWKYVPGHQGDPGNEAADKLAVAGITSVT